jgi:Zn-finger nucleic acid-binding protein
MRCPNHCETPLVPNDRAGVELDYCPTCRGVWLDRGELDKILDRELAAATTRSDRGGDRGPERAPMPRDDRRDDRDWDDRRWDDRRPEGYGYGYGGKPHKKKKIWDLLDFD